jgi:hypothetical protein
MFLQKFFKYCCINTTNKSLYFSYNSLIAVFASLLITSCNFIGSKDENKPKNEEIIKQKEWEANVFKKVDENKGGGITLFGGNKRQSEVAGDNVIWQASLQVLGDIPLAQANYTGGVIITDWYSSESSNESIKISIFINSARLETSSFDVKSFKKTCSVENSCKTTALSSDFNQKIKDKVLERARDFSVKKEKENNKK